MVDYPVNLQRCGRLRFCTRLLPRLQPQTQQQTCVKTSRLLLRLHPFNGAFMAANTAANNGVFTPVYCCVCSHKRAVKRLQTIAFLHPFAATFAAV
ncbi:hypothetical protein Hanom_Chr08g00689401 [Helianthus anomalus]